MRTSSDPKESTNKMRLNDETRKHIEKKSKKQGVSMSEYIRKLIEKDIYNKC